MVNIIGIVLISTLVILALKGLGLIKVRYMDYFKDPGVIYTDVFDVAGTPTTLERQFLGLEKMDQRHHGKFSRY